NASMNSAAPTVHRREADFHDLWATTTDLEAIDVRAVFEGPTALENRFVLGLLGTLQGKRILDVGAGLGESTVYFALQGASVTCTDLSAEMVAAADRLAKLNGVNIAGVVTAGETLPLPEDEFDVVYVANTIHHVTDKQALLAECRRVLK